MANALHVFSMADAMDRDASTAKELLVVFAVLGLAAGLWLLVPHL